MRSATPDSLPGIRTELVARLRARVSEIEDAIFARVRALSEPSEADDPELIAGLRAAVAEALDYGLVTIEHGDELLAPIPAAASAQARRAARYGVGLDTVLRRYAAGDRLLGEFIMDEADRFPSQALKRVLRANGPQVDRLMAVVATEYMREVERMRRSPGQRIAERVQKLLAGDASVDVGDLGYELDAWHLGAVVLGPEGEGAARALAAGLGCQGLVVPRGEGVVWAWLGSRRPLPPPDAERLWAAGVPQEVSVSVGEPRRGLAGWRLTHHEAQAAFEVMLRKPRRLTRSSDTILLAAVLRDEALAESLRETYLAPLGEHGSSAGLRETLRAYFAAGFNAATAAAALGVDRHTVKRRLRKAEETLGQLLQACHAELEVALGLEELENHAEPEALLDDGMQVVTAD